METTLMDIFGIVQGVGFRPFVSRLAARFGLAGTVCNKGSYVEVMVQGQQRQAFCQALVQEAPPRSVILKTIVRQEDRPVFPDFQIVESARQKGQIFVSPDIAICDDCKRELFDRMNRRYLHPFINCTACGPRLTILETMPYDRERTTMKDFPMCPQCYGEYVDPATRRYDAQPVCCNDCGPEVYILDGTERGPAAITKARRLIARGRIVAIKGIGGFHLCCDATNEAAVKELRRRKKRPVKPFALMLKDLAAARSYCTVEPGQETLLDGHEKPILLLAKKTDSGLAPSVAPDNPKVGVMLPYAPLQLLLFTYDDDVVMPDALVMTSANESGAPICRTDEDVRQELTGLCDGVLSHNRRILLRADDSVTDWYDGGPYMIRRSRGYAPLPFFVDGRKGQVLAVGGELKNAFCLTQDELFYLSPYVGDMGDIRTVEALKESGIRLSELLEIEPAVVACDTHPHYNTVAVAHGLGLPVVPVQHHYAHILSCMAENNYLDPVIGLSFDGTGYGDDGTIWGGEVLVASPTSYERMSHITPFLQLGGDAAAREGWRIATSMLYSLTGRDKERTRHLVRTLGLCTDPQLAAQFFLADKHVNGILSTSAGRLFDAVSAVLGLCRQSTFEGEAAMRLQFAAEEWQARQGKQDPLLSEKDLSKGLAATGLLFHQLVCQALAGEDPRSLAWSFHEGLSRLMIETAVQVRDKTNLTVAALSGGVFQNRLLLGLTERGLQQRGFTVLRHHLVPPNDGGLALGQALYAASTFNFEKE